MASNVSAWRRALTEACGQPIILASASPRRRSLLEQAGVAFEVVIGDAPEALPAAGEAPQAYAERSAGAKACVVAERRPHRIVLGADTVVAVDGLILGKPEDEAAARAMLQRLSGREHEVHTGCALAVGYCAEACEARIVESFVITTQVIFRRCGRDEIAAYVATGEPLDKAGAYGIQGLGGRLVASVRGSYDNVVGLPVAEVVEAASRIRESAREASPGCDPARRRE